jgi:hypothetical protein
MNILSRGDIYALDVFFPTARTNSYHGTTLMKGTERLKVVSMGHWPPIEMKVRWAERFSLPVWCVLHVLSSCLTQLGVCNHTDFQLTRPSLILM